MGLRIEGTPPVGEPEAAEAIVLRIALRNLRTQNPEYNWKGWVEEEDQD